MANGNYLAPGEHGLIGASVVADERGGVPLDSAAWRLHELSGSWDHGGWVRLQHLLTGKYLRLVAPPDPMEWTFSVERDPEPHGKQTRFQIECSRPPCSAGPVHVRVHPDATGAHINHRGGDLIRGHGDRQPWMPSPQSPSSLVRLETFGLARLASDMARWAPRRRACFAPCEAAADASAGEGGVWDDVCGSVYAEPFCSAMVRVHGARPGVTWGSAPAAAKARWARLGCQNYVSAQDVVALAGPASPLTPAEPPQRVPASPPARSGGGTASDEERMHCVEPTDGVLLLLVSDRPNQFLCHYFAAAMAHSLRPTILGWDPNSWLGGGAPKPWTFHLGAKLVAPLHYLRACGYSNETLVVFTDHDVIFQGGYPQLRAAYASAVQSQSAPILFSTENEPYPTELKPLYPPKPRGAPFRFLNSGMWMGPVGAVTELLEVMAGVRRGDSLPMLLDTYLNWGSPRLAAAPTPRAYVDNDQLSYACLFISQHVSDVCQTGGGGRQRALGSRRCVTCPHDGKQRCMRAGGMIDCSDRSTWERPPLSHRLGLDHGLGLFENFYHAGRHRLEGGKVRHVSSGATPLVIHFNGPAKVVHEPEWGLPTWGSKQDQPKQLRDSICAALSPAERAAADERFLTHATFLDPTFRRVAGGPLNASCTGVAAQ